MVTGGHGWVTGEWFVYMCHASWGPLSLNLFLFHDFWLNGLFLVCEAGYFLLSSYVA